MRLKKAKAQRQSMDVEGKKTVTSFNQLQKNFGRGAGGKPKQSGPKIKKEKNKNRENTKTN